MRMNGIPSGIGKKAVIASFLLLCAVSTSYSQRKNNALLDSVLDIPYDVMVANLAASDKLLHEAYAIATSNQDYRKQGLASNKLGIVHYLQGEYDSSAYYRLQAIEIFEKNNFIEELAATYCEYGYSIKRRNLPEAFRYMKMGIGLLEKAKDDAGLTAAYDNYGVLHEMNTQMDSAIYYYQKGYYLKKMLLDSIGLPYSLNNLGGAKLIVGDFEEAKKYFEEALKIREQRNDAFGVAESHSLFGDLYRQWKKFNEAIIWYAKSNMEADVVSYTYLQQYNYEKLAECYEAMGNFQQALQSSKQSMILKDSLLNEKNLKQINELEQRFRVAEKDKSIALLQEKNARRNFFIILIASLFILSIALGALYNQVQKRKARQEKDEAIIKEREKGLEALITATEEERKRIAKDLHDGVGQQLSGLRMSFESLAIDIHTLVPAKASQMDKLALVLDEACKEVRGISHQMMPKALGESGLVAAIGDMLAKSLGLTAIHYRFEHFKVTDRRFNEKVELGIFRVCQELVNNIIKHSGATEVVVQLYISKSNLILIVEDNGKGFGKGNKEEGIGLTNITSRINTVDGEVTWEPGPQHGTVATVKVPV
jgi:signal transduction histidine kinase